MPTYMYRWRIPPELQSEFEHDWESLTRQVLTDYGMISADLYRCGDDHISITVWASEEEWQKWVDELSAHPYRNRWREYKIAAEVLTPIVKLGTPPTGV